MGEARRARLRRPLAALLVALLALAGCGPTAAPPGRSGDVPPRASAPAPPLPPSLERSDATFPQLERAHRERLANVWVEGGGTVIRILRDDTKRPRHQRFVVRVGEGESAFTVLVAHDIDVAPRVPLKQGDAIAFRGEYIWGEQGGTVHWTHRDPKGGKGSGGWIRLRGIVYR